MLISDAFIENSKFFKFNKDEDDIMKLKLEQIYP